MTSTTRRPSVLISGFGPPSGFCVPGPKPLDLFADLRVWSPCHRRWLYRESRTITAGSRSIQPVPFLSSGRTDTRPLTPHHTLDRLPAVDWRGTLVASRTGRTGSAASRTIFSATPPIIHRRILLFDQAATAVHERSYHCGRSPRWLMSRSAIRARISAASSTS